MAGKKAGYQGSWTIDKVNPPVEQGDIMVTAKQSYNHKTGCSI
jgi:hypothetical protein